MILDDVPKLQVAESYNKKVMSYKPKKVGLRIFFDFPENVGYPANFWAISIASPGLIRLHVFYEIVSTYEVL